MYYLSTIDLIIVEDIGSSVGVLTVLHVKGPVFTSTFSGHIPAASCCTILLRMSNHLVCNKAVTGPRSLENAPISFGYEENYELERSIHPVSNSFKAGSANRCSVTAGEARIGPHSGLCTHAETNKYSYKQATCDILIQSTEYLNSAIFRTTTCNPTFRCLPIRVVNSKGAGYHLHFVEYRI
jgi:hypothetical protein